MKKQIAERIRMARQHAGMTQAEAAMSLGVDKSAVAHWERGATVPTNANFCGMARAYGVDHQWLATGEGDMHRHLRLDDMPAARLECFALTESEERILLLFRRMSPAEQDEFKSCEFFGRLLVHGKFQCSPALGKP